jgi:hypothetical protein
MTTTKPTMAEPRAHARLFGEHDGTLELYKRYDGQAEPQLVYIALDLRDGEVWASYKVEIGGAVPAEVYHGLVRRYYVAPVLTQTANRVMTGILPLAQRVLDGKVTYSKGLAAIWPSAHFTGDAHMAEEEIRVILDAVESDLHIVQADEWMADETDDVRQMIADGCDRDDIAEWYQGEGVTDDSPYIEGLFEWVEGIWTAEVSA